MDECLFPVEFLPEEERRERPFCGKRYRIIGHDDTGNLLGIAADGTVYYLDTGAGVIYYAAASEKILLKEIEAYKNFAEESVFPENPSDEVLERETNRFKEKITELDEYAFYGETLWAVIAEQMEYGL